MLPDSGQTDEASVLGAVPVDGAHQVGANGSVDRSVERGGGGAADVTLPAGWVPVADVPSLTPDGMRAKGGDVTEELPVTVDGTELPSGGERAQWGPGTVSHKSSLARVVRQRVASEALQSGILDTERYAEVCAQSDTAGGFIMPATRKYGGKMVLCTTGQWETWPGVYDSRMECLKACKTVVHGDNDGRWRWNPKDHKVVPHLDPHGTVSRRRVVAASMRDVPSCR